LTRFRPLRPLTVTALGMAVLLAACGGGEPAADEGQPSGEVLEGTISDAMLPLDTVRSQPPLAEPEAATRAGASVAADDAAPDATTDEEAAAPAEPAAEAAASGGE